VTTTLPPSPSPRYKRRRLWRWLRWVLLGGVALALALSGIYLWVGLRAQDRIYDKATEAPTADVALVLGTSPWMSNGQANLYFTRRIRMAADLYHSGKVRVLLVSGDNARHEYNEPAAMRQALRQAGVPNSAIVSDYAGFRTFDSVVRALQVFGQRRVLIVSQRFHLERALTIADAKGLEAYGVAADDVQLDALYEMMATGREVLARVLLLLDLYVLHTEPRFLGEPEHIEPVSERAASFAIPASHLPTD